mmetsp:Transcript_6936/g.19754  ORF Transcript_6936/g.19754 Transcript_6936/m.19754 type:complete len:267 (-) Transcript_6936:182-982(-)
MTRTSKSWWRTLPTSHPTWGTIRGRRSNLWSAGIIPTRRSNIFVLASKPCSSKSATESSRQPGWNSVASFDVNDNLTPFNSHPVSCTISSLHIFLVFIFNKSKTSRLSFFIGDQLDISDWSKSFHFSQQLPLSHFVRKATNKQRIVAIHSLIFPFAVSLFLSVALNQWSQLVSVLLLPSFSFLFLQRLRSRLDFTFRRFRVLKCAQILQNSSDGVLSLVLNWRNRFQRRRGHERRSNVGWHQHHGRTRVVSSGHLSPWRHLTTTHA